jgi:hypothetical protein
MSTKTILLVCTVVMVFFVKPAEAEAQACAGCAETTAFTEICVLGCPVGDPNDCSRFCVEAPGGYCGATGGCDDPLFSLDGAVLPNFAKSATGDPTETVLRLVSSTSEEFTTRRGCDGAILSRGYALARLENARKLAKVITL